MESHPCVHSDYLCGVFSFHEVTLEHRIITRFQKALSDYNLIEDGDRILIGLSGGKDSLCLLEFMAKRMRIFKPRFTVEVVHIRMQNIAYESDTSYLESFAAKLGVNMHILTTSFEASTDKRKSPCFLCSWNRRKQMFALAKQLGCNKIALGHHMDDIIHTAMMNEYFQGRYGTMSVSLKMDKMPITIIRPLCLEHEADILQYAKNKGYKKQTKLCPYEHESHRTDIKRIFNEIEKINAEARYSVWNALEREGKIMER